MRARAAPIRLPDLLHAVLGLGVVLAAVLGIAGQGVATLLGGFVLSFTLLCGGVFFGFGLVRLVLAGVSGGLGYLGIFLGLHMGGLGVLDANILGIALLVVAFFLGGVVSGIGFGDGDLLGVASAGFVLGFVLCFGDLLRALGFGDADVLGVVLQGAAFVAAGLVVSRDAVFLGLVLFLGQCHGVAGEGAGHH